jgi:hypothetical protein
VARFVRHKLGQLPAGEQVRAATLPSLHETAAALLPPKVLAAAFMNLSHVSSFGCSHLPRPLLSETGRTCCCLLLSLGCSSACTRSGCGSVRRQVGAQQTALQVQTLPRFVFHRCDKFYYDRFHHHPRRSLVQASTRRP